MTKTELMELIIKSKPKQWKYETTYAFTGEICAETITLKPSYDISIWVWNKYCAIDVSTGMYCGTESIQLGYNYPKEYLTEEFLRTQFERIKKGIHDPNEPDYSSEPQEGFLRRLYRSWFKVG